MITCHSPSCHTDICNSKENYRKAEREKRQTVAQPHNMTMDDDIRTEHESNQCRRDAARPSHSREVRSPACAESSGTTESGPLSHRVQLPPCMLTDLSASHIRAASPIPRTAGADEGGKSYMDRETSPEGALLLPMLWQNSRFPVALDSVSITTTKPQCPLFILCYFSWKGTFYILKRFISNLDAKLELAKEPN